MLLVLAGERYVCFMDESAAGGMRVCGWLCMAIVCFARGEGYAEKAGMDAYQRILRMLGWRRGELKWRKACRAARKQNLDCSELVEAILGGAAYTSMEALHISSSVLEARLALAAKLLRGAVERLGIISLAVMDQGLVPERDAVLGRLRREVSPYRLRRLVFRSSEGTPGIQLADLLAGYRCEAQS